MIQNVWARRSKLRARQQTGRTETASCYIRASQDATSRGQNLCCRATVMDIHRPDSSSLMIGSSRDRRYVDRSEQVDVFREVMPLLNPLWTVEGLQFFLRTNRLWKNITMEGTEVILE